MYSARNLICFAALGSAAIAAAQLPKGAQWDANNYINWHTIRSGTNSNISTSGMTVLSNEGAFRSYWQSLTGNPANTAPVQGIDWNKQEVLAVTLGQRSTGGYGVMVKGITKDNNLAIVNAVEQTPLKGVVTSQQITRPWVLVSVERKAVDYRLSWSSKTSTPNIILGPGGVYIGPGDQTGSGYVAAENRVQWSPYDSGTTSQIYTQQMFVLTNEDEYTRYVQKAFGGQVPPSRNNWDRYQLVAVHIGAKPTTGYAVVIRNVLMDNGVGVIRAFRSAPIAGESVRRGGSQPWVIVRVDAGVRRFSLSMEDDQTNRNIVIGGGGN